jgi:hypothetical protein
MSIQSCSWSWSPLTSCYGTLDRWVAVSWKLWSAIFWFWLESAFVASDAGVLVRQVQRILKLDVRTMVHYVYVCTIYAPIYMVLMLMLILKSQASKQIFWCCFKWSSCSSYIHSTKVVRVAPLHIPPLAYYKYNRQTVLNIWAQKTSMVIRIPGALPTSATAPRTSTAMLYHRVTNYFSLQLPPSFTSSILHGHHHS